MEGRQYVSDEIGSFADDNHLASKDMSSPENAMLKHENASLKDSKKLRQKVIEIGNEKLDDSMMSHIWEERNKKNNLQINSLKTKPPLNTESEFSTRKKYHIGSHKVPEKEFQRKNSQIHEKVKISEGRMIGHEYGAYETLKLDDKVKDNDQNSLMSKDDMSQGQRKVSKYKSTHIDASDIIKNSWLVRVDEFEVEPDSPFHKPNKLYGSEIIPLLEDSENFDNKKDSDFNQEKIEDLEELQRLLLGELMQDATPADEHQSDHFDRDKASRHSRQSAMQDRCETISELSRQQRILINEMLEDINQNNAGSIDDVRQSSGHSNEESPGSRLNDVEIFSVGTPMVDQPTKFFSRNKRPSSSETPTAKKISMQVTANDNKRSSAHPNLLEEQVTKVNKKDIWPFEEISKKLIRKSGQLGIQDNKMISEFHVEQSNELIKDAKNCIESDSDEDSHPNDQAKQQSASQSNFKDDSKSNKYAEGEQSIKNRDSHRADANPVFGKIISNAPKSKRYIDSPLKKASKSNSFRKNSSNQTLIATQSIKEDIITPSCKANASTSKNKKSLFDKPPIALPTARHRRESKYSSGKSPNSLYSASQVIKSLKKESDEHRSPQPPNIKERRPQKLKLNDESTDQHINIRSEVKQKTKKSFRPCESVKRSVKTFKGLSSSRGNRQFSFNREKVESSSSSSDSENHPPQAEKPTDNPKKPKQPKVEIVTVPQILINTESRSPDRRYKQ